MAMESLGEALKGFVGGYQNAKSMEQQKQDRERQRLKEHANGLLETLNSPLVQNNPKMQATMLEAYADALDRSEAGPQKTKRQAGIGGLIKNMFGIGREVVDDGNSHQMRKMLDETEKARQASIKQEVFAPRTFQDRNDHGDIGTMLGVGGLSKESPSVSANPPQPFMMPGSQQMSRDVAPPQESRTQMSGPQSSAAMMYQGQRQHISPDKLIKSAQVAHTGKYGIQDTKAISADVQAEAMRITQDMLEEIDAWRDVTPGHETWEQAMANPTIRKAISGLQQYENAGLIKNLQVEFERRFPKQEQVRLQQNTYDYGNGTPYVANYNAATGQTTHPSTGAVIPNPRPYEPQRQQAAPPPATRVYDYLISTGLNPADAMKKLQEIDSAQPNIRQRYEAGQLTPQEAQAFITRVRALDKPASENRPFHDLERYRVTGGSTLSSLPGGGFSQTTGGSTYDVGALIDAIRNTAETGMTLERVAAAMSAYPEGSPEKKALADVVRAFNRESGRR